MGKLSDALEALLAKWDMTTETWRDNNARTVDEQYIALIAEAVRGAIPAIGHMSDVAQSSFRKVGDPDREQY